MKTNTTASTARADEGRDGDSCRDTGLNKPECHCQTCLRALVARFAPDRQR